VVFLASIGITVWDYQKKSQFVKIAENTIGKHLINSEARLIMLIQLSLDVRSMINLANGVEFPQYQGADLGRIDRFKYLSYLV
jgi:hypothetical protein